MASIRSTTTTLTATARALLVLVLAIVAAALLPAGARAQVPHPPSCFAEGPGLESGVAGQPSWFTIYARDAQDSPVSGANFDVEIDGALAGPVQVEDLRNGSYAVRFIRTTAGPAAISVTLERTHIRGSPFRGAWATGPVSARHSLVSGTGLRGGVLERQPIYTLRLDVRDAYGNAIHEGGHQVSAWLEGPARVPIDLLDLDNGVYISEFEVTLEGSYDLGVTLGGQHVASSPYTVRWRQSAKSSGEEFEPWLLALVGCTLGLGLIAGLYCWCARWRHRRALESRPLLIERLESSAF